MKLSDSQLESFIKLYKQEFGFNLSIEDARYSAECLIFFQELLAGKFAGNQQDVIMEVLDSKQYDNFCSQKGAMNT